MVFACFCQDTKRNILPSRHIFWARKLPTFISERKREKETKLQSQVTTVLRELLFVNLPVVTLDRRKLRETRSTFNCGKSLSMAAYKLSMLYTYLMSFFCLSLQKSIRSVMLHGHKFKRKAEGKRNKMIIDLQRLYSLFILFFHSPAASQVGIMS